jgi:hypothetical protein
MLDLVRKHKIRVFDHGSSHDESAGHSVDALADAAEIRSLKKAGYQVEQHEDVDKHGKARQKEIGRGDRYQRPGP